MAGGRCYEMTPAKRTDKEDALIPDPDMRQIPIPHRNLEWAKVGKYSLSKKEKITIGRCLDADICIDDRRVSQEHASICRNQDDYILRNFSQINETLLIRNGKRVEGEMKLENGDRIELVPGVGLKVSLYKETFEAPTEKDATLPFVLKVILDADVADYSGLMKSCGADQIRQKLNKCYEFFEAERIGHHVDYCEKVGDNILVVFGSVKEAISYAKAVQGSLSSYNQQYSDAEQMQFRMGIASGDVVFDPRQNPGECVFGDAVNLSERIQSVAPAGGVCVSQVVYEQAPDKGEFESVQEHELKNRSGKIDVYRLKLNSER